MKSLKVLSALITPRKEQPLVLVAELLSEPVSVPWLVIQLWVR